MVFTGVLCTSCTNSAMAGPVSSTKPPRASPKVVSAEITQLEAEAEKLAERDLGATKPQFVNSNLERRLVTGGRGLNSLFCRDHADRIVINSGGVRVLDALPRHEDLALGRSVCEPERRVGQGGSGRVGADAVRPSALER